VKETKKPVGVKKEEIKTSNDKHPKRNVNKYIKLMVYKFKNENGEEYAEVHIDMIANYDDTDDDYLCNLPFGGNLSVRKPPHLKPLVIFGQDEAIYRSTSLCSHTWTIDGQTPLQQKEVDKQ
jgi:hypothetical protein